MGPVWRGGQRGRYRVVGDQRSYQFEFGFDSVVLPWQSLPKSYRRNNQHCNEVSGRGDWIRTSDFYLPKIALYQAELRPDAF